MLNDVSRQKSAYRGEDLHDGKILIGVVVIVICHVKCACQGLREASLPHHM